MRRAVRVILAMACVPVAGFAVWGAWIYTTWALQARTAGWISALVILAVIVGIFAGLSTTTRR